MIFKLPIMAKLRRAAFFCVSAMLALLLLAALPATAQTTPPTPAPIVPAPGSSCTVSALNQNAPVAPDLSFTIFNIIPALAPPFRARATCSDGTVGQTVVVYPVPPQVFPNPPDIIVMGDIIWGQLTPAPLALGLTAPVRRLTTNQTAQLAATAIYENGTTRNVTSRLEGTTYNISNDLLGTVTESGLVTVLPLSAQGSSSRVVTTAITEGGAAASYMFILGPRGSLTGKVTRADGISPVAGAEISVLRTQPRLLGLQI